MPTKKRGASLRAGPGGSVCAGRVAVANGRCRVPGCLVKICVTESRSVTSSATHCVLLLLLPCSCNLFEVYNQTISPPCSYTILLVNSTSAVVALRQQRPRRCRRRRRRALRRCLTLPLCTYHRIPPCPVLSSSAPPTATQSPPTHPTPPTTPSSPTHLPRPPSISRPLHPSQRHTRRTPSTPTTAPPSSLRPTYVLCLSAAAQDAPTTSPRALPSHRGSAKCNRAPSVPPPRRRCLADRRRAALQPPRACTGPCRHLSLDPRVGRRPSSMTSLLSRMSRTAPSPLPSTATRSSALSHLPCLIPILTRPLRSSSTRRSPSFRTRRLPGRSGINTQTGVVRPGGS